MKELLTAVGATIDDVVELTTFHAGPKDSAAFHAEFERYMPVHREFFGEHRPAWTAVGTTALLSPTAVVEMRVVAVAGSGRSTRVVRGEAKPPAEKEGATSTTPAPGKREGEGLAGGAEGASPAPPSGGGGRP